MLEDENRSSVGYNEEMFEGDARRTAPLPSRRRAALRRTPPVLCWSASWPPASSCSGGAGR